MKAIGIICEYNPFHNGHLYHLTKIKELYPDYIIICILGGAFMQRGEISILSKWEKTDIALYYGVDLVIELPFVFASQSADIFAKGSIQILKILQADKLVFGSESNDINNLINLAKKQINNKNYDKLIKDYMDEGISYPMATNKASKELNDMEVITPNDILGLAYIKQILIQKAPIEPITIKRTNDYHNLNLNNKIVSASSIRKALKENKTIKKYIPSFSYQYLKKIELPNEEKYFNFLKYKILSDNNLALYQTVDEGIENRIKKYILDTTNINDLITKIKTKRYTFNKINRMFIHILTNFTKKEALNYQDINYIRVLGFNKKGQQYLNKIKKDIKTPLITNYSNIKNNILFIDERVNMIYSQLFSNKKAKIVLEQEYKNKPIKRD